MLTLVQSKRISATNRLHVAVAHVEAAILHINNEAQRNMPMHSWADAPGVDDLRLIVRALSDVVDALRAKEDTLTAGPGGDDACAQALIRSN